jgi:hypothetical protein
MKHIKILPLLEAIKYILLFVLILMFINFNTQIVKQTENTNKLAKSTNQVVKGQGDILKAIKQVTEDTRITASQQTSIIICMLQVPIAERSTDLQAQCRKEADAITDNTVYKDNAVVTPSPQSSNPTKDTNNVTPPATKDTNNEVSPAKKLCIPIVLVKVGCK